jgi:hypothetical protein
LATSTRKGTKKGELTRKVTKEREGQFKGGLTTKQPCHVMPLASLGAKLSQNNQQSPAKFRVLAVKEKDYLINPLCVEEKSSRRINMST